jgi:four helix bundle protein
MEEPKFDLDERTFQFALSVRFCVSSHRWSRMQWRDVDQILRSSGSVAANYAEANNAVSPSDFFYRIRVSKKECVETQFRLRLLGATSADEPLKESFRSLYREADELIKIFGAILRKAP